MSSSTGEVGRRFFKKGVVNATSTFINGFLNIKAGKAVSKVMTELTVKTTRTLFFYYSRTKSKN